MPQLQCHCLTLRPGHLAGEVLWKCLESCLLDASGLRHATDQLGEHVELRFELTHSGGWPNYARPVVEHVAWIGR